MRRRNLTFPLHGLVLCCDSVRNYAVSLLRKAEDDELLLYLLQLVQALKCPKQQQKITKIKN